MNEHFHSNLNRNTMKSPSSITAALILLLCTPAIQGFAPISPSLARPSALHLAPVNDLVSILLSSDALEGSSTAGEALSSFDPAAYAAGDASNTFLPSYSKASYYTTLALYLASFPGLWSQIKRSTKAKVKRKTYVR
jgi:hypothetical protein